MTDLFAPEVFWLTVVNIALGIVCVGLLTAVVFAVVADARERRLRYPKPALDETARTARTRDGKSWDDDVFVTPGLGLTMADGGEPYQPRPGAPRPDAG